MHVDEFLQELGIAPASNRLDEVWRLLSRQIRLERANQRDGDTELSLDHK